MCSDNFSKKLEESTIAVVHKQQSPIDHACHVSLSNVKQNELTNELDVNENHDTYFLSLQNMYLQI